MWKGRYEFPDGLGRLDDGLVVAVGLDARLVVLGVLVDALLSGSHFTR